jgi:hypothetical protein
VRKLDEKSKTGREEIADRFRGLDEDGKKEVVFSLLGDVLDPATKVAVTEAAKNVPYDDAKHLIVEAVKSVNTDAAKKAAAAAALSTASEDLKKEIATEAVQALTPEAKKDVASVLGAAASDSINRLAEANPGDILKVAATQIALLASYYKAVLDQAKMSFRWALIAAGIGLVFFLGAVLFLLTRGSEAIATVGVISGALIEVIAGINFYLTTELRLNLQISTIVLSRHNVTYLPIVSAKRFRATKSKRPALPLSILLQTRWFNAQSPAET